VPKNYCNRTPIAKVIVENVVTCFLGTQCRSPWFERTQITELQNPNDRPTFIRPRQKHKQHNSTIYKKYEKKLDKRNVREVPKQTFVNMPLGLIKCNIKFFKKLLTVAYF